MSEFKKEVHVRAAFDKRYPDPTKDYGIHGCELAFYLIGPKGAIQFVIYTNWYLPHVQDEMDNRPINSRLPFLGHKPIPADIGRHSHVPMYEGETPMEGECNIIGGTCYYDGSGLQAEDVFKIMLEGGTDALWAEMERRYHLWLEPAP